MDKNFQFRRQFILSSNPEFKFDFWKNVALDKNIFLSVHPDLEMSQSVLGDISLTMLGFALNPFVPEMTNQDVLDNVIRGAKSFDEVIKNTEALSGRWLIIYQDKQSFNIFHDPCGHRQVYYYCGNDMDVLCGSEIAILKHFKKFDDNLTPEIREVIDNPIFRAKENAWVGPETLFKDVMHLLPNKYLNVRAKSAVRFWPYKPIENIDLKTATNTSAEILKGTILAMAKRTKIAVAVTAGWDSRVLLAACKDIKDEVTYFISVMGDIDDDFYEIKVPKELLKKLNLPFYIQPCNDEIEPEFKEMIEKNVANARTHLPKAKNIYKYHLDFDGMVSVNGNVSEIGRMCIRPFKPQAITAQNIVKLGYFGYGGTYFEKQFDLWLSEISDKCEQNNLNIYDMIYWEQRMGNWGAVYPTEQDIAIDQLSPFNNRLLLTTMLSLDEKYRDYPNYTLHYEIIKKLWPETLQVKVGVVLFKTAIKLRLKHYLSKVLYQIGSK